MRKKKAKQVKIPAAKRPPKKPRDPRLGPPLRQLRPRKWPKELA